MLTATSYADLSVKVVGAGQTLDGGVVESRSNADITNPRVSEAVCDWLTQNRRRPFFMFIHMWDVHFDFIPPPPYDRMFDPDYTGTATGENFFINPEVNPRMPKRDLEHIIALYDGEIAWTDEHVGKILDRLDTLNLSENTIVMLLSDHGEEFFEPWTQGPSADAVRRGDPHPVNRPIPRQDTGRSSLSKPSLHDRR